MSNEETNEGHSHLIQYKGAIRNDHISLTMQIGESVIATITFAASEDPAVQHDLDVMVEDFQTIFDRGLTEFMRQQLEARGLTQDQPDADDIKIDAEAQV